MGWKKDMKHGVKAQPWWYELLYAFVAGNRTFWDSLWETMDYDVTYRNRQRKIGMGMVRDLDAILKDPSVLEDGDDNGAKPKG